MNKLKIVQLESFYPLFMQEVYAASPGLQNRPFDAQIGHLLDSGFSGGHNVVPYLNPSRWAASYIVVNCPWSQAQWAAENGLNPSVSARDLLLAQLQKVQPDILYLSDIPGFDFSILASLQKRPLLVGWHATALSSSTPWSAFDLVLSGIHKIRQSALDQGAKAAAEYMPAAPPFKAGASPQRQGASLVFSGSFYGGIHDARARQFNQLAQNIGDLTLDIYSPTPFATDAQARMAFFPAVYGNGVLDLYSSYRIVLDSRGEFNLGDVQEPRETSNMRVFEATRAGSLLLTERSPNLQNYFEFGTEIETYASFDELVDKINFYSAPEHQTQRERIAAAGLRRVRQEHLIEHRAARLEQILDEHFGLFAQPASAATTTQAICLSTGLDSLIFTLAALERVRQDEPHSEIYLYCHNQETRQLVSSLGLKVSLLGSQELQADEAAFNAAQQASDTLYGKTLLLRYLFNHKNHLQRVTYVSADLVLSKPLRFAETDDAIYVGVYHFGHHLQHAIEAVGLYSAGLISVPRHGGGDSFINTLLDGAGRRANEGGEVLPAGLQLASAVKAAEQEHATVRTLTLLTPWSQDIALEDNSQMSAALFGPISFVQKSQWQFSTFDSAPGWPLYLSHIVVPCLQGIQALCARYPALDVLGDQHTSAASPALSQYLANHESMSRSGYRLLSEAQYQDFSAQTSGWDTPSVAAIQHHSFQALLAEFRAGRQRADMRALTRLFKRFMKPHMRVLEEGCGSGYNSELIASVAGEGFEYVGIDIASAMIHLAKASYPQRSFQVMTSENLAFDDASFDIVLNGASLMHTIGYDQALAEARRVASKYVVLHTITVADTPHNIHFEKSAYGSRVPEVCFSAKVLSALLARHSLLPVLMEDSIDYNLAGAIGVPSKSVSIGCYRLNDPDTQSAAPANHYCTYFDINYLPRGVLMMRSLLRHDPQAVIFVLCLDEATERALATLSPQIRPLPLRTLLAADPAFAQARDNRTLIEWYFTATSCLVNFLLAHHPNVQRLIYLDADLYFYTTPAFLIDEAQGASVQIIEHRFSPQYVNLVAFGRFNVAWIAFTNTPDGRAVVDDYRSSCLEWCYDRLEGDKFGDQKYLDKWPGRYPHCCVSAINGANVAWWNMANWVPHQFDDLFYVGADLLVFYHFQEIKRLESGEYATKKDSAEYGDYYRFFYAPYLAELTRVDAEFRPFIDALGITDIRYKSW